MLVNLTLALPIMSTLHLSVSDYPVKLVTVYKSSKAEIVRAFPLKLEASQFLGFPSPVVRT